jgi:hypothetical protein
MSGTEGHLPQATTYKRRYDVSGIMGNIVPINLDFLQKKNLVENYQQIGLAN